MRKVALLMCVAALLAGWACQRKSRAALPAPAPATEPSPAEAPPPAVTPVVIPSQPAPLEPAPLSTKITTPSNFELAELSFQVGHYSEAARSYEAFLSSNPRAKNRDRALFNLGLCRLLARDTGRDWRSAEAAFRKLKIEYPSSPYRGQADFILGLEEQIEKLRADVKEKEERIRKLSEELQKLKDIDLQRRPSPE